MKKVKIDGKRRNHCKNERRYVLEQQGTWDYKSDGIKQLNMN